MRRPLDWAYAERSASRLPIRRNLGPDRLRWTIHRSRYPPLCSRRCPSNCPIPFFLGKLKLKFRRSGRIGVRRGTATSKRPLFRQVTGRGGAVTAGGGARRDVTCRRRPMSVEPAEGRSFGSAPLRPQSEQMESSGKLSIYRVGLLTCVFVQGYR